MIVADASAVLAILLQEPEGVRFDELLRSNARVVMSPVNLWEVLVRAMSARGEEGRAAADALIAGLNVEVISINESQTRAAVDAFGRFGRRTPAGLNLGDCFAYALAKSEGCALLFKGDDFPKTDVARAV